MLKIPIEDIINKYNYWFHVKEIAKYDLYIMLDSKEYEFYAINLKVETVSYVDGKKVKTIPLKKVKEIVVKNVDPLIF